MALEAATFISQLNDANPAAGDLKSQGDDHIRMLKDTLLNTFPNFSAGAVSATTIELSLLKGKSSVASLEDLACAQLSTAFGHATAPAFMAADTAGVIFLYNPSAHINLVPQVNESGDTVLDVLNPAHIRSAGSASAPTSGQILRGDGWGDETYTLIESTSIAGTGVPSWTYQIPSGYHEIVLHLHGITVQSSTAAASATAQDNLQFFINTTAARNGYQYHNCGDANVQLQAVYTTAGGLCAAGGVGQYADSAIVMNREISTADDSIIDISLKNTNTTDDVVLFSIRSRTFGLQCSINITEGAGMTIPTGTYSFPKVGYEPIDGWFSATPATAATALCINCLAGKSIKCKDIKVFGRK